MFMKRTLASVFFALMIVCLGASLLMVAPVENVEAWKYHPCCDYDTHWFTNGHVIEIQYNCQHIYHSDHWWSCGLVCP